MIRSMTGFGREEIATKEYKLVVEIKSVNHRYGDFSIRLPKKLNFLEANIRGELKKYISRGKVDVFITYEDYTQGKCHVKYNPDMARSYIEGIMNISNDFLLENTLDACMLSRYPEVFTIEEETMDEEAMEKRILGAIDTAAENFVKTRVTEGENLRVDLENKLDYLVELVDAVELRSPEIIKEHQQKIMDKVEELLGDKKIDDSVLATELVIYSDKICTDEETVRLRSHIQGMKDTFQEKDSVGRKLDFIAQEMNREANTILSKANDMEISNHAINLKTEIEKIREQIQNIE